ncbi:hypothetical protein [Paenibacillus terreus]
MILNVSRKGVGHESLDANKEGLICFLAPLVFTGPGHPVSGLAEGKT